MSNEISKCDQKISLELPRSRKSDQAHSFVQTAQVAHGENGKSGGLETNSFSFESHHELQPNFAETDNIDKLTPLRIDKADSRLLNPNVLHFSCSNRSFG